LIAEGAGLRELAAADLWVSGKVISV